MVHSTPSLAHHMLLEMSLRGGSRVSVFPPWNEVEVPPSVATGFKRRRVVVGTLVAV